MGGRVVMDEVWFWFNLIHTELRGIAADGCLASWFETPRQATRLLTMRV
jgi:hypothetical protein